LLNVVLSFNSNVPLSVAIFSWQRVAYATLGSRALLHLRKANEVRYETESKRLSSIVFQAPTAIESGSRSFADRIGDEIEGWLAPDPQLYPSARLPNPPPTATTIAVSEGCDGQRTIQTQSSQLSSTTC